MKILVVDYAGHPFQYDLSCELGERGHLVAHSYSSSTSTPQASFDSCLNVTVTPVSIGRPFEKYRIGRRLRDELSYGIRTVRLAWRFQPDRVLTSNVPLVSLLLIWMYAFVTRRRWVLWLQDIQSGLVGMVSGDESAVARIMRKLEYFLIRRADHIVVIADGFKTELQSAGVSAEAMTVIENWAPLGALPERPRENPWAEEHGLIDKTVFLYSGTLGMKHSPKMLKALAEEFADDPSIEVVVITEGAGADWLSQQPGVKPTLLPFQPFDRLPDVLASGDVLLVLLEATAGAFSVPSKTLTYLCAGRPILGAIPAVNLSAEIIAERSGAGVVVEPGDSAALCTRARELAESRSARIDMARSGRDYAQKTFDRTVITHRFEAALHIPSTESPESQENLEHV